MALVTLKELLEGCDGGFAVGAFNVHNMEYVQAVLAAAEAEQAPLILAIGAPMLPYFGMDWMAALCKHAAAKTDLPAAVHLDHAKDFATVVAGIRAGLSSVMIDGSHLPFAENVALTKKVVEVARAAGVSVEGELGAIGGVEDDVETLAGRLTDPAEAERFVAETGVDALAVAIGNCHGLYKGEPRLDMERLAEIARRVAVPLVMHGGSDIPDVQVRQAVELGIVKFNVATELKIAFTNGVRQALNEDSETYELPKVLGPARAAVTAVAREKVRLLGSSGKASQWRRKRG